LKLTEINALGLLKSIRTNSTVTPLRQPPIFVPATSLITAEYLHNRDQYERMRPTFK